MLQVSLSWLFGTVEVCHHTLFLSLGFYQTCGSLCRLIWRAELNAIFIFLDNPFWWFFFLGVAIGFQVRRNRNFTADKNDPAWNFSKVFEFFFHGVIKISAWAKIKNMNGVSREREWINGKKREKKRPNRDQIETK